MAGLKLEGTDKVIKNLNKAISKIDGNVADGINESLDFIKKRSSEKTPVENFKLIKTIKSKMKKTKNAIAGVVGYTSPYAAKVHESPGTLKGQWRRSGKGRYWDPDGEPKFLQKTVTRNVNNILTIIKRKASKKPV